MNKACSDVSFPDDGWPVSGVLCVCAALRSVSQRKRRHILFCGWEVYVYRKQIRRAVTAEVQVVIRRMETFMLLGADSLWCDRLPS